jgi:hypothetical protein
MYRFITELNMLHRGKTAIVIGNGPSRDNYALNDLFFGCIKIGCNTAFRKYSWIDFIVFQDDEVREDCLAWAGNKIALHWQRAPSQMRVLGGLYYFTTAMPRYGRAIIFPKHYTHRLAFGSSGFIAAQMAFRMGCDKIILVGCDCCPSERKTDKYYEFRREFEYLNEYCKGHNVLLAKLGLHGCLDIPVIEEEEV